MKKIINGRLYDTETAKEIGTYSNGYTGIQRCVEVLYQKKTGEFFLNGYGGAMSKYSERCDGGWSGNDVIIPFSESEAKQWVEKNLSANKYLELWAAEE